MTGLTGIPLMREPKDLVLWRSGRDYYAAGRKAFRLSGGGWQEAPTFTEFDADLVRALQGRRPGRRPDWLRRSPEETRELLAEASSVRVAELEAEAVSFLRKVRERHQDLPLAVSWSGGKDSTVASGLARQAFPNERLTHIFADTTIELPCTYDYLATFREANPTVPFAIGLAVRDFFALCREIGPPSRIQRWCCTTHKAAPLADVLGAIGGGDDVLVVSGLRRAESRKRQDYQRVIGDSKIGGQVLLSPMADWTDFDVWAWTLSRGIVLNTGYKQGLDRIGCAFCPDSRAWSDMVGRHAFGDYYIEWEALLIEVADKAGVRDPECYVAGGAWKNRRGGGIGSHGLLRADTYQISLTPCESSDRAVTYTTKGVFRLDTLGELLKVFGAVSMLEHAGEFGQFEVIGPHGDFVVEAFPHWERLQVTFGSLSTRKRLEGTIRAQLRKLQACVGCGGCAALCPHAAIVQVGEDYRIDETRCTHCLRCVRAIKAGCWAADSVHRRAYQNTA